MTQPEHNGEPAPVPEASPVIQPPKRGVSVPLLIFLVFPLIGLSLAMLFMFLSAGARANAGLPTPGPVTLPPMPTPIDLANTPAVEFQLTSFDGALVDAADYRGRVVFLNFWATWCEPCKREMPALAEFAASQPADGAAVLAVNVEERRIDVEAFLNQYNIRGLTVLLDPTGDTADDYGIFQLPVTYVIDGTGVIRYPKYGEITLEELNAYTEALNAERAS